MNINLLKSSSNNLLNIIVESTPVSSCISIISSELCVRVCARTVRGLCGHCRLCGCLAWRKARWASAAVQSLVYLMRRPHAKLMWTSRSQGVHSEHAQISPRLQHTAANRTVLLYSAGLTVSSSPPDGVWDSVWFSLGRAAHIKTSALPASPLCFTDAVWEGIIMEDTHAQIQRANAAMTACALAI